MKWIIRKNIYREIRRGIEIVKGIYIDAGFVLQGAIRLQQLLSYLSQDVLSWDTRYPIKETTLMNEKGEKRKKSTKDGLETNSSRS